MTGQVHTGRPSRLLRNLNAKIASIPMMLTAVVIFLGGTIWTVVYSFTNSKLLPRAKFVGFDQYERLWSAPRWIVSIENLAIYGVLTLIFSLVQPLVFLGLFGPLLVGSSGEPVGETLQWFVPGVLVMIVLFGTGAVGSNLQYEMMTGSHERTLVAPLSRSSLLVGRALKEIAPIVVQAVIIVLIAWPFGFRARNAGVRVSPFRMSHSTRRKGSPSWASSRRTL